MVEEMEAGESEEVFLIKVVNNVQMSQLAREEEPNLIPSRESLSSLRGQNRRMIMTPILKKQAQMKK